MEENEFYAIETFGSTGRGTYEIVFKGSFRILAGCLYGLSRDLLAYVPPRSQWNICPLVCLHS
jgi:hypothetical protein